MEIEWKNLLPPSLLAGLTGGGLLVFLTSYAHAWCWDDILFLNPGIFYRISDLQGIVLEILILFLAGMLAVALQRGEAGGRAQAVFAGAVSGCTVVLINEVHFMVSHLLRHESTDPIGGFTHLIASVLANNLVPLLFLVLSMAILAVLGAVIISSSQKRGAGSEENVRASRLVLGSTILLILALAVLPPLTAQVMIGNGMVDMHSTTAMSMTVISVEHTAPDTIVLTVQDVPGASFLTDQPFSVYIDGADVSNAAASAASGFAGSVNPPEGLEAVQGSQVTWQGAGVQNNSTPFSVVVWAHATDGSELCILDHTVGD